MPMTVTGDHHDPNRSIADDVALMRADIARYMAPPEQPKASPGSILLGGPIRWRFEGCTFDITVNDREFVHLVVTTPDGLEVDQWDQAVLLDILNSYNQWRAGPWVEDDTRHKFYAHVAVRTGSSVAAWEREQVEWLERLHSVACPRCGAEAGHSCRTTSGKAVPPHRDRRHAMWTAEEVAP
jgi:hypothetical protein